MGSLLPEENTKPKYAQLYIYDTITELQNRLAALGVDRDGGKVEISVLDWLMNMFDQTDHLVKLFHMARDKILENQSQDLKLRLMRRRPNDSPQYDAPTLTDIGGLIVGDIGEVNSERDLIIEDRANHLQRVTKLHPKYMSLQYPLLFPYGEDGYREDIKLFAPSVAAPLKRQ